MAIAHRAFVLLVSAALSAACGLPDTLGLPREPTEEEIMDARAELAARPGIEEAIARYDEMLQRIRTRIDAELGPRIWYESRPRSWSGCGDEFSGLGGHTASGPAWAFAGSVSGDLWPRASRIVADVTAEYGFITAGLQVDDASLIPTAPDYRTANGIDSTLGAHYRFGTEVNTTLRVTTGCHPSTNPTPCTRRHRVRVRRVSFGTLVHRRPGLLAAGLTLVVGGIVVPVAVLNPGPPVSVPSLTWVAGVPGPRPTGPEIQVESLGLSYTVAEAGAPRRRATTSSTSSPSRRPKVPRTGRS
ncbi:hypothetical protein BJF78_19900 [Pseudonocardia sp. CNS-139]|nr:hypothetical protein BJF78_19900 [Pseudonocardia sp. CNS-139]